MAGMSIEKTWLVILHMIYGLGMDHHKDDSPIREELGLHFKINNPVEDHFPPNLMITSEKFIELIKQGVFDIKEYPIKGEALADYVDSINQNDKIYIHNGSSEAFVYTYPERLRAIVTVDKSGNIDTVSQLDVICRRLEENIGSNRAIAVLYQAGFDSNEVDIPCLQLIQAIVRDDELSLTVFFRSNDIYGAFPSNMLFISNIGLMIQDRLIEKHPNLRFRYIDYHVSSAHIYATDLDAVEKITKDRPLKEMM